MFEDSLKRNQEVTKADAWGWITVLLIVSFLFGSILSSVAAWYYKKENERK
jgi:multisubunit Na+/H+ antiporter MnhG subunit